VYEKVLSSVLLVIQLWFVPFISFRINQ